MGMIGGLKSLFSPESKAITRRLWESQFRRDKLLMMLRDADDPILKFAVNRPFATEMALVLGFVGATPHGTIGVNYLLQREAEERKDDIEFLFEIAEARLNRNLNGRGVLGGGAAFVTMEREGGSAASAVALPDFYERMAEQVGSGEILAVAPNPDILFVTTFQSAHAEKALQALEDEKCRSDRDFTPCAFRLDGSSATIVRKVG